MKRILILALAAATLVGLGACSSDSKLPASNATVPSDLPVASDLSVPAFVTGDCKAIYAQMIGAMTQAFAPAGEQADLVKVFGDVSANVPDELQGDVDIMSAAMTKLGEVMQEYNSDMASPEVAKAMQELSTPEVQAASARLNAYFETACPQG